MAGQSAFSYEGGAVRSSGFQLVAPFVVMAVCMGVVAPEKARAQALDGGIAVSVAIDQLANQVRQLLDAARSAGNALEIGASQQAGVVIENAKNVYATSLGLTVAQFRKERGAALDQLHTALNELGTHTGTSVNDALTQLQQVANTLPFRKGEPQLSKVSPRFVVPSKNTYPVHLVFQGNFPDTAHEGHQAILTTSSGKKFNVANTTKALECNLPVEELFPTPDGRFSFTTVTLEVPWSHARFLKLFGRKWELHQYTLYVGALPAAPGRLMLVTTKATAVSEVGDFGTTEFLQTSGSEGGNTDRTETYQAVPRIGCTVMQGTSRFVSDESSGEWSKTFVSDSGNQVVYRVTTIYNRLGTSGRVRFKIMFKQSCPGAATTASDTLPISLKWGDTVSLPVSADPAVQWKIVAHGFDGSSNETGSPGRCGPFFNVAAENSGVRVATADPQTLVWP